MTFLKAENLTYMIRPNDIFSQEKKRILWRIPSLEISAPGIVLLAGRNGVGKSTLIRGLLGLIKFTEGQVIWFDNSNQLRGKIGYLPELPVLPARIKVGELLESLLDLNEEKIKNLESNILITESIRISNLLTSPAHLLSKGQQQRLLLHIALAGEPKGFVLDEPFSGLDPWARNELADVLISLANKGHFLLISSHESPLRMRAYVRETWIIENETLKTHPGYALPE